MKIHHQQAANLYDFHQNIEFKIREKIVYHQIGNAYLQNQLKREKDVALAVKRGLVNGDVIRLVNNALAYCFKEARLSTTGGSDIEHNIYLGQNSTITRALTGKNGDLLSHFDKILEPLAEIENTSLKQLFVNNHDVVAKKGKIKGQ